MSDDKIREVFEASWGYTNEEQDLYFLPELNMYGCQKISQAAEGKSTAWYYFQKGWKQSQQERAK